MYKHVKTIYFMVMGLMVYFFHIQMVLNANVLIWMYNEINLFFLIGLQTFTTFFLCCNRLQLVFLRAREHRMKA